MKKLSIIMMLLSILMLGITQGAYVCTNSTIIAEESFSNSTFYVWENLTIDDKQWFSSINDILARTNFSVLISENSTILTGDNSTLTWSNIDAGLIVVNSSNLTQIYPAVNYTVDTRDGRINWTHLSWNGTDVTIYYNITFQERVTSLEDFIGKYELGLNQGEGEDTGWRILDESISGQDWIANYSYYNESCTNSTLTSTSCTATKNTIFAAFALLALAGLVMAAFGLIQMWNNGADFMSMTLLTLGLIALAIILFVGTYVIATIAESVCVVV